METWLLVILAVLGTLGVIALIGGWLIYSRRRTARRLMSRIGDLPWRGKVQLAGDLFRDERVPLGVRIVMPFVVLYLILPIDLIPDFIPIIGQLDDLALIILVLGLLLRAMPVTVIEEHIERLEVDFIEGEARRASDALPPPSLNERS
jgi:uncharacterized membrane protein YkvA (DUF1232 family)